MQQYKNDVIQITGNLTHSVIQKLLKTYLNKKKQSILYSKLLKLASYTH